MATLQDYEDAKRELEKWQAAWDNYDGNNPDKYRTDISNARARLHQIEQALKQEGLLPLTEHETLERELDRRFPNAKSKQLVEHEGKRYMRRFTPVAKSRSGNTVKEWHRWWEEVSSKP